MVGSIDTQANGGDIVSISEYSPAETWTKLENDPSAIMVDVRTQAEWSFVGLPDLSALGKEPLLIEWKSFPTMESNDAFADQLLSQLGETEPSEILFLCRSGVRSLGAASLMQEIFAAKGAATKCVNIAEGFEGDLDSDAQRGKMNGWKARGLAWRQS